MKQSRRKPPMMTAVAGKALGMAEVFGNILSEPFPGWSAEAAEPMGPSTGGGKQALQHLSLVSPQGSRLAIGTIDWPQNRATLRTHAAVDSMHQQRYRKPFPVSAADYQRFVDRVTSLLRSVNIPVTMLSTPVQATPGLAPQPAAGSQRSRTWLWIVTAALLASVATYLWMSGRLRSIWSSAPAQGSPAPSARP